MLTLTAGSSAPVGSKALTITGTSGSQTATTSLLAGHRHTGLHLDHPEDIFRRQSGDLRGLRHGGAADRRGKRRIPGPDRQVNFCDATAAHCDAIHLIGSAQLTSAGTASLSFIPGMGNHSYQAVFAGTLADGASSSSASSLAVTASQPSTTTIAPSGNPGNYTLTATVMEKDRLPRGERCPSSTPAARTPCSAPQH